jgi:hypothetical protein
LKKEFDVHRAQGTSHPLMKHYGVDAVPLRNAQIDQWRNTKQGIRYLHAPTNLLVFGGVDDVWQDSDGKLIVVDYKATAKDREVTIDAEWQAGYKRQVEVYQWLFRKNGFEVSDTAYFVYCNGKLDKTAFDGKLEFQVSLLPYKGDDSWVESTLTDIKECLEGNTPPPFSQDCDFCAYVSNISKVSG